MAFYRIENDEISKSENDLFGPGFDLLMVEHDKYTYPAYGWYWFDSDEEASSFFGIEIKAPAEPEGNVPPFAI